MISIKFRIQKLKEEFNEKRTITKKDLIKGREYSFKLKDQVFEEYKGWTFIGVSKYGGFLFSKYKKEDIFLSDEQEYDYFYDWITYQYIISPIK